MTALFQATDEASALLDGITAENRTHAAAQEAEVIRDRALTFQSDYNKLFRRVGRLKWSHHTARVLNAISVGAICAGLSQSFWWDTRTAPFDWSALRRSSPPTPSQLVQSDK